MQLRTFACVAPPLGVIALLASHLAQAHPASQGYHYDGSGQTRTSGSSCSAESNSKETVLSRWSSGVTNTSVNYTWVYCPIMRRNLQAYGDYASTVDGARLYNVTVGVTDYSVSPLWCYLQAQPTTTNGGLYISPSRNACSYWGGCTDQPAFTGLADLSWSAPFGYEPNSPNPRDVHAANLVVACRLPGNSSVRYLNTWFKTNDPEG